MSLEDTIEELKKAMNIEEHDYVTLIIGLLVGTIITSKL